MTKGERQSSTGVLKSLRTRGRDGFCDLTEVGGDSRHAASLYQEPSEVVSDPHPPPPPHELINPALLLPLE